MMQLKRLSSARTLVGQTLRNFSRPCLGCTEENCKSNCPDIVHCREKYLTPSLKTFQAYDAPVVLDRGNKQYLYDKAGNEYIDLLGQNLCISVGYGHPKVIEAATEQLTKLAHCTTMYHHEQSAFLARELVEKMPVRPDGEDWVVHLVNDGSEAVDLAI